MNNGDKRYSETGSVMKTAILTVNLLASFASAGASFLALRRPASMSGSVHVQGGELFYVRMYAARAIPFGFAAGLIPFWTAGEAVVWLLLTAAVIQMSDVVIAMGKRERGMMIGASLGTIIHLLCAIGLWKGHL
jgi:hypothetical protein